MKLPQTLRRIAVLAALLATGACLWRPPPIPPLSGADSSVRADSGISMNIDAAAAPDAGVGFTDQEACDRAARMNDGAVPATVYNDGRLVNCNGAPATDAATTVDGARGDSAVDSSLDGTPSDGSPSDPDAGSSDDGAADASSDDASSEAGTESDASAPADGASDDGG